jgi:hypothetical protein
LLQSVYRTNGKKPKNKIKGTFNKYKKQQMRISICPAYTEDGSSIRTYGANHGNGRGAKKGSMMNIKEKCYIYQFNRFNKLIQEQKHTKESDKHNSLIDIAARYQHTPTSTSLNTRL